MPPDAFEMLTGLAPVKREKKRAYTPAEQRVLNVLKSKKAFGATCYELELETCMLHQSCSPVLLKLRKDGIVKVKRDGRSGKTITRKTSTGRPAWVYVRA